MSDNLKTKDRDEADLDIASKEIGGVQFPRNILVTPAGADLSPLTNTELRAAAIPVSGTFWQATQPVSGTFWQATQPVSFTWAGLTDAQLRATPVNTRIQGDSVGTWPGYSAPDAVETRTAGFDGDGALITRSAVLTDEGTFRVNFANISLVVAIGAVTVSGAVVTGTGFLTSDVHKGDYFKVGGDADTAYKQIGSIDSDTQMTLVSNYSGSASGTGNRTLVLPLIGTGGSLAVASGQLTMASGTTDAQTTGIKRLVDYAPLVYRARASISQRIANQTVLLGMEEDVTTPKWFARFRADGVTNTTVVCESGRNPTGAPSVSETEVTTITLPGGANTATMRDWRIEVLTESCRFYVDTVLVAEHVRTIPSQHDEMACVAKITNATGAASTTSVVVDYMTGKNHNKLEVGIMSDTEKLIASAAPLVLYPYNVAGVIAINTDLIVLDCLQLRSLFIHCLAIGTTGVVTVQWSSDAAFTAPITATLIDNTGATSTTFNSAGLRATNVLARYCRLRLTTATTAGTTTINIWGAQSVYVPLVTTQPVSGTVTATVASTRISPNVADGHSLTYHLISAASTNDTLVVGGAHAAGMIMASNLNAAVRFLKLYNKATAPTSSDTPVATIALKPGETTFVEANSPIRFSLGIGIRLTTGIAVADTGAVAASEHSVSMFYT